MKFTISPAEAGKRLDKFLTDKLGRPRNQVQKLVKAGLASVNDKTETANYIIKVGDVVELTQKTESKIAPEVKQPVAIEPEIIDETADYLVVDKPAGRLAHGAGSGEEASLADWLVKKYPQIKKVGDDPSRPGIVHRLDKDVSGLMLVAKTQDFFEFAKEQFKERTIEKKYTALVHGKIPSDLGLIDFPIQRSVSGHKMAARPRGAAGRRAESEFEVIRRFLNFTLLKVKIKTGRTHQIRAHLAAYGAPLVGDNLYGTRATKEKNKKLGTDRVYLVADQLAFTDLSGERKKFTIELPEEFNKLMKTIK